jgi:hypothetical protein
MILGLITLGFLALLLLGRMLTVLEIRSLDRDHRHLQNQISELEGDLDTSRRKYLIALKAEGVARHKLTQVKTRHANLKQNLDQIELTTVQQKAQQQKAVEQKIEALVMEALGGPSVRRDTQFKQVMGVIHQLIDLEKHKKSEDLIAAIQDKLAEITGKAPPKKVRAAQPPMPAADEPPPDQVAEAVPTDTPSTDEASLHETPTEGGTAEGGAEAASENAGTEDEAANAEEAADTPEQKDSSKPA